MVNLIFIYLSNDFQTVHQLLPKRINKSDCINGSSNSFNSNSYSSSNSRMNCLSIASSRGQRYNEYSKEIKKGTLIKPNLFE
jgi:hypothetical protein